MASRWSSTLNILAALSELSGFNKKEDTGNWERIVVVEIGKEWKRREWELLPDVIHE